MCAAALSAAALGCSTAQTSTAPTATPTPGFHAAARPIDSALAAEMTGSSWREGCPVPLEDLRLVELAYRDFAGAQQQGELVVHRDVLDDVTSGFRQLYDAGFPIRSMRRVDAYGSSDDGSMAADNTSAFNCRTKPDRRRNGRCTPTAGPSTSTPLRTRTSAGPRCSRRPEARGWIAPTYVPA